MYVSGYSSLTLLSNFNYLIFMQTKHHTLRGFTLIELLVVIAIIGILSSVVLASLNTARQKGSDAAVKSDIATIRTQAALDYGSNGDSYGTFAWTVPTAAPAAQTGTPGTAVAIFGTTGDSTVGKSLTQLYTNTSAHSMGYGSNGTSYAVAGKLSTGSYWCVDSNDYTGVITSTQFTATATSLSCQ